ncbi:MAG TPA: hypothetical protein VG406_27165 [Isosphaeraceae bacterium]|jgi:hypothetical protein|nr:hypothetical protein [Isosphaeraceae bacterium]
METEPRPDLILGQPLVGIAHSPYSEPEFILEGIGPARFRTHYLSLANGVVLNLFTAELFVTSLPADVMPGETSGLAPLEVLGRRVVTVARDDVYATIDDVYATIIVLEGGLFLKDNNDGCYGNPLLAGRLSECYTQEGLGEFLDYWSEQPMRLGIGQDV